MYIRLYLKQRNSPKNSHVSELRFNVFEGSLFLKIFVGGQVQSSSDSEEG